MRVFITGITGTLGTALAKLHHNFGDAVVGCARSESRAVEWMWKNPGIAQVLIGDAADLQHRNSLLCQALSSCDHVYHCAALKHVEICERQPMEAVKENILLTEIVSLACYDREISLTLASTDKALQPEGVYGATKLIAEKIVLQRGYGALRMVNLIGSSGSVLHKWLAVAKIGHRIELTDPDMTRYFMTVEDAAQQMFHTADKHKLNTVNLVRAVRMGDLAEALTSLGPVIIGPRPGETRHQWLTPTQCSMSAERWDINELLEHARKTQ